MSQPERWFEDFVIGETIALGSTVVTEAEIRAFAKDFGSPVNAAASEGALATTQWHVSSLFMRQFCDGLLLRSAALGSPGIDHVEWPVVVRAGDTIASKVTVADLKASRSRPAVGLVRFEFGVDNQHGAAVMRAQCWAMFGRREAGQ